jgi:hypothetical protein
MHVLTDKEFIVLAFIFAHSMPRVEVTANDVPADKVAPDEMGWTLDKDDEGSWVRRAYQSLADQNLIEDSGYRRRGRSGLYQVAYVVTDRAVELYGKQLRQMMQ